jgi:hypothetical protein
VLDPDLFSMTVQLSTRPGAGMPEVASRLDGILVLPSQVAVQNNVRDIDRICRHQPSTLSDFSTVNSGGSGWIIPVAAPRRMVEVDNRIAVPGNHRIVKGQRTDSLPALKLASLA